MRAWASYMACGLGAALVAAACCMPAAVVRTEVSGPVVDVPPALIFQHYLVLPIAGRAFPADSGARAAGDAIPDAGMWPARLILAAALASLCLIAAAMRRA
ncbi:MAG: hypothetical protein L6Q95_08525, partial [Planctomycetes bacterium]|nr:hypothetical protein [Planctomycetota bacterium]